MRPGPKATEGERVAVKFNQISKSRRLLPPLRGPPSSRRKAFVSSNLSRDPKRNEIVLRTMKSERGSDEIFSLRLQMKLNPPPLTLRSKISSRSDFIHDSGFIPLKADLVEKSTHLSGRQMCAFFL